jgi:hypothetical protein
VTSEGWRQVRSTVAWACAVLVAAVSGMVHVAAGQDREAAAGIHHEPRASRPVQATLEADYGEQPHGPHHDVGKPLPRHQSEQFPRALRSRVAAPARVLQALMATRARFSAVPLPSASVPVQAPSRRPLHLPPVRRATMSGPVPRA